MRTVIAKLKEVGDIVAFLRRRGRMKLIFTLPWNRIMRCPTFAAGLLLAFAPLAHGQPSRQPAADPNLGEFFESKVRPVLAEHCFSCHGPQKQRGDVRLDAREHLFKPRDEGPIVVPGQPEKSALVRAIRQTGDIKMPPKGKLNSQQIDDLAAWVKLGAVWPVTKSTSQESDAAQKHWAFQPIRQPKLPDAQNRDWARTAIDGFILQKLEATGLTPNPRADARTLLRRLYLDLIGLPPTARDVEEFVTEFDAANVNSVLSTQYSALALRNEVVERTVERLLNSPQFGERWGRYWLDVARYADSKGYVFQEERRYPYAYTYRDYVVDAFNRDLPFDQFIMEQLAADRLVASKQAEPKTQAAMGFLTLGRRFLNNVHDIIDDRIDVVTRGLMGLTVQCARCHDHKYDPIPSKDYYSLYGIFASSTEPKDLPLIAEPAQTEETVRFQKKLSELKGAVARFEEDNKKELAARNRKFRDELRALQKKVDAFQATTPGAPPRAMALVDLPQPMTPHVFLRGNPNNPGPAVPRQFLEAIAGPVRVPFKDGSGRLELAHAVASKDNPLTARVFVNRVWLHLMGSGLVTTPSNFGMRADPPSHPELLDYLTARFMDEGWSTKKLIRTIVLSNTYQLSSQSGIENARSNKQIQDSAFRTPDSVDPDNRLYWRANRRRLDLEAMRDALLFVSGNLDLKHGGPAVDITRSPFSGRRTIYGFVDRQNLPGLFRTFDFASPDATSPQRHQTTVPQQALFLLNSPFVQEQARGVLKRVDDTQDAADKIQRLHRRIYARPAHADEVRLGETFLQSASATNGTAEMSPWERYAQVLLLANEFLFVD